MRNIKYILINETHSEKCVRRATVRRDRNLGYHYIVTSECVVRNTIEIREPGHIFPSLSFTEKDFNAYSIGVQLNGSLSDEKIRLTLVDLLVDLRLEFPAAKILGVCEIDGNSIKPNNEMNRLRLELSNEP